MDTKQIAFGGKRQLEPSLWPFIAHFIHAVQILSLSSPIVIVMLVSAPTASLSALTTSASSDASSLARFANLLSKICLPPCPCLAHPAGSIWPGCLVRSCEFACSGDFQLRGKRRFFLSQILVHCITAQKARSAFPFPCKNLCHLSS